MSIDEVGKKWSFTAAIVISLINNGITNERVMKSGDDLTQLPKSHAVPNEFALTTTARSTLFYFFNSQNNK